MSVQRLQTPTNANDPSLARPSTLPFARQVFYGCPREHRETRERILMEEIGFDSHPHCDLRAAWQQSESPSSAPFVYLVPRALTIVKYRKNVHGAKEAVTPVSFLLYSAKR